ISLWFSSQRAGRPTPWAAPRSRAGRYHSGTSRHAPAHVAHTGDRSTLTLRPPRLVLSGEPSWACSPRVYTLTISNREDSVPVLMRLVIVLLIAIGIGGGIQAQIAQITSNPIPVPIVKRGLAVEIKDLVRLPETRGLRPVEQDVTPSGWARISYVRDLPDRR